MPRSREVPQERRLADPARFFERELTGENPLTRATAKRLYNLAADFFPMRPWDLLEDQDLILVAPPDTDEMCYCSVMGTLGQVFSLQVYIGSDGYRLFQRIASGEPITPGEFYVSLHGVSVELVTKREQTSPDRELLQAMGHPSKRGLRAPIFRAARPGYHPWYVTEEEGRTLAACLEAEIAFCDYLSSHPDIEFWNEKGVYPLVSVASSKKRTREYAIRLVEAPSHPVSRPEPPSLNEGRIAGIQEKSFPVGGAVEVDHFYGGATYGGKHERKACLRTVLVVDAAKGFVYPPVLGKPSDATGDLLVDAVLGAIECGRFLPREVRVQDAIFGTLLRPLAGELGFFLQVAESLPALNHAKRFLLEKRGDPGPIPV